MKSISPINFIRNIEAVMLHRLYFTKNFGTQFSDSKAANTAAAFRTSNVIVALANGVAPECEDEFFHTLVRRLGRVRALDLGFEPEFVADAI